MIAFKDEIKTSITDPKRLLLPNLIYTSSWLNQQQQVFFKSHKITSTQYNILRILKGSSPEPVSVGEIKKRVIFRQSDITRLIDRLVEKKLVLRELCPNNRRKMDVSITKQGEELLEKINPKIEELALKILQTTSTQEAERVNNTLDRIRNPK